MDEALFTDPPRWRFQHKWLQDEELVSYIGKQIDKLFFFSRQKLIKHQHC